MTSTVTVNERTSLLMPHPEASPFGVLNVDSAENYKHETAQIATIVVQRTLATSTENEKRKIRQSWVNSALLIQAAANDGGLDTIAISNQEKCKIASVKRCALDNIPAVLNNARVIVDFIIHSPFCVVLPDEECAQHPSEGAYSFSWATVGKINNYASKQLGQDGVKQLQESTGRTEIKVFVLSNTFMIRLVASTTLKGAARTTPMAVASQRQREENCCTIL